MKPEEDLTASAPLDAKLDAGVKRVILLASGLIVFSIILIGSLVYSITEREVVTKLKTRDLFTLASSISTKVDAKIERAKETSLVMANDPLILVWVKDGERNKIYGDMVREKTEYLHDKLGYSTTFVASAVTKQYWDHLGSVIGKIDESDPSDAWFFASIHSGKAALVNFDYSEERGDTFVFVNALAGDLSSPAAVVGVGMNLAELSKEFATYGEGQTMNLWLADPSGKIYLSAVTQHNGKNIADYLPASAMSLLNPGNATDSRVIDYVSQRGERMDLIRYPLHSTDLSLLIEVERKQTVSFLQTIRWNTIFAVILSILSIVFLFYYVSRKLANPYKRAIEMNRQLEAQVTMRTQELSERNAEMVDSINYALLLQQSVLPKPANLESLLEEPFLIWRPRDVVGGDFFWIKRFGDYTLAAVGDCTGHGVPGAFMTILALSSLERVAESTAPHDPAAILGNLHRIMKQTLQQEGNDGITDDGLALGLCSIGPDGRVIFAGASCTLYRIDQDGLRSWKGDKRGIGYRRTPSDYTYMNHELPAGSARLYLPTDGFFDQNGGERDHSFGKTRFEKLLEKYRDFSAAQQKDALVQELEAYMAGERQRDDIAVLSFRTGTRNDVKPTGGGDLA